MVNIVYNYFLNLPRLAIIVEKFRNYFEEGSEGVPVKMLLGKTVLNQ
jgi:hypothetical protein